LVALSELPFGTFKGQCRGDLADQDPSSMPCERGSREHERRGSFVCCVPEEAEFDAFDATYPVGQSTGVRRELKHCGVVTETVPYAGGIHFAAPWRLRDRHAHEASRLVGATLSKGRIDRSDLSG
jgi:hypothetical protein